MVVNPSYLREKTGNTLAAVVGNDRKVPLGDGRMTRYINLDNAASTPAFQEVCDFVQACLPYYSSIHRGSGFKSQISSRLYDQAHEAVAAFFGADLSANTVIFTKNATEAINKLSYRFPWREDSIVLTSQMEHHSNDLPWRDKAECMHTAITAEGTLDLEDLQDKLNTCGDRISLVAVSGASNVTGLVQPIHRIAEMAHAAGAKILVDAAQLAGHRAITMKPDEDPGHIDFLAFSAHKMYAPFGTGALVGPREVFLEGGPEYSGGGTIESVTTEEVRWAGLPDREEGGSPNTLGALALAASLRQLQKIGMDKIARHEKELTDHALGKLGNMEDVVLYGDTTADRVGVISFNLKGIPHARVAAVLSHEYGVGVRNGCFCAHPYVASLLDMTKEEIDSWQRHLERGDKSDMPGMVRISFGCYNTMEEIEYVVRAIKRISRGEWRFSYKINPHTGEYEPGNNSDSLLQQFMTDAGLYINRCSPAG